MMNKICAIIPVYNHPHHLRNLVNYLKKLNIFVIMVDDGSDELTASTIINLSKEYPTHLKRLRHIKNKGKGAAIKTGLFEAERLGFLHALQIDADGQHNWQDIPKFIAHMEQYPNRIIIGYPVFDSTINKKRYYARYITHIWIWINTLSFEIKDSMCGFRIYPVAEVVKMLQEIKIGNRMDFDPEILVRMKWKGYRFINLPTSVSYPEGNVSHFILLKDNLLLARMHTKLFFLMLIKSPLIIYNNLKERKNEAKEME